MPKFGAGEDKVLGVSPKNNMRHKGDITRKRNWKFDNSIKEEEEIIRAMKKNRSLSGESDDEIWGGDDDDEYNPFKKTKKTKWDSGKLPEMEHAAEAVPSN